LTVLDYDFSGVKSGAELQACGLYEYARESRAVIKLIEDDGWYLDRTRGSHRQYKHPQKRGLVTIAGKPGDDLAPGTKNSILKQSGLK